MISNYTAVPDPQFSEKEEKLLLARRRLWRIFLGASSVGSFMFGLYITTFYVRSIVLNKLYAWDQLNPGMYHKDRWDSNVAFGLHLVAGAYMMLLGPLQFVPTIRRKWIQFHRWNGRLTAGGAILTSLGALYYVLAVGSTTKQTFNEKVEWSNFFFGVATLFCGIQIIRHAAFTKDIDIHKLYAYRLAGIAFGNIFGRLYLLVMFMFLGADASPEDMKPALDVLQCILTLPFILLADEIWRREQREEAIPSVIFLVGVAFLLALFIVLLTMQIAFAWMPFMGANLDDETNTGDL